MILLATDAVAGVPGVNGRPGKVEQVISADNSTSRIYRAPAARFHPFDGSGTRLFGIRWFPDWFNETTFGATVTFGKPILLADLPDDTEKATDIVLNEIKTLSD